jgi:hypothetical protein
MSGCGCDECGGITLFKGDTGATGATGAAGSNGAVGEPGGFSSTWVFDAGTSANPIATEMRFNNATLASVTEIYINDTNSASIDMDAFLDSFSNTVNTVNYFGLLKIYKKSNSNIFWYGRITALVDNGADHTLTVTHIQSNGVFVADDVMVVNFTPNGRNNLQYKDYSILISQSSTSAPTIIALGNNEIGSIVWTRASAGTFIGTLSGAFTADKTKLKIFPKVYNHFFEFERASVNAITLITKTGGVTTDGLLDNVTLEVQVYY